MTETDGTPTSWRWRAEQLPPGPAVVVDIDGVLADASGRQHLVTGYGRDWDAFFEAAGTDSVIGEVARLLDLLEPTLSVVLLTARPGWIERETVEWLERHRVRWDLLVMRSGGSYLRAVDFKRQETAELKRYGFELRLALEDDRRNAEMFESEGVPCLYIHSGYYD